MQLTNPVIKGFNPDPSIVAVDGNFYIATSTFEWFPGVQIHHSKDLKNWRLLTRPLSRVSQLDLRGCPHSCGVWAPCLSYSDGLFWLIFANVRSHGGPITDSPCYLVTAPAIEGSWSEPIYMGSNGFDPSLFHDQNGKKYLVNMQMGAIGSDKRFDGITVQEYDHSAQQLIGERVRIWDGALGVTEGPHLYQKDGYYYLLTAEGGTGRNHAVSMARSRELFGTYETDPANPMLTSAARPDLYLQTAGHGDLFQAQSGEWYMTHLCQRPTPKHGISTSAQTDAQVCILGRETALQRVDWPEGEFPRLHDGGNAPFNQVDTPLNLPEHSWYESRSDEFNNATLNHHFQTLREPVEKSWCSLDRASNRLSLKGRNSLYSCYDQTLVARRLQHFQATAETCIHFSPTNEKQEAGIIAYYDRANYHYLRITSDGRGGLRIGVVTADNTVNWGDKLSIVNAPDTLPDGQAIYLKIVNHNDDLRFAWSLDRQTWNWVNGKFASTNMGDGASQISAFTGTFWGLCCQDTSGDGTWAEFDYFRYTPEAEAFNLKR